MNNHVFKGHRTLLGSKFVTYGELELPTRYDLYPTSESGFEWGNSSKGANQLAFSILCQLSNAEVAKEYAIAFTNDIVRNLNNRDWVVSASEVLKWIEANCHSYVKEKKHKNNLLKFLKFRKVQSLAGQ
ncbi:MAG: DUF6166 domain-containing protein [Sulfurimonas sp.]